MAGHVLLRYFRETSDYDIFYTSRDRHVKGALRLDALDLRASDALIEKVRPDIVMNAIGILNKRAEDEPGAARIVNSLLPHRIARKLDELGYGGKLVHISTDCVFSGELRRDRQDAGRPATSDDQSSSSPALRRGRYDENSQPDGRTVYAQTKAAGEVRSGHHLTIRTSIIGPEIRDGGIGLFEWFMQQRGSVLGYTRVWWNGVTTLQLAKSIDHMLQHGVTGLYHLTAPEIVSKYTLLRLFAETFRRTDVSIEPADEPRLDRTLVCTRTDYEAIVPDYRAMMGELSDWMRSS